MGSRGEALSPSSSVNSPSGAGSIYSASTKASPGDREAVRKAPFPFGQPTNFVGKTVYRPCRTGVYAPTDWDPALAVRSSQEPKASLELQFVYGYNGQGETSANLHVTSEGNAVYYVAGVGIVYDRASHSQKFFLNHNDDISCLTLCEAAVQMEHDEEQVVDYPPGVLVASGQTIPIVDGKSARPFVCIWDTRDQQEIRRIYLDAEERDVFAVSFSPNGEHLATISADDYHTVSVWDWRSGERICDGRGANAGNGVVWDTFSADCSRFCSFGMRALKMWEKVVYDEDNPPNPELPLLRWNGNSCSFGKCPMDTLVSAVFLPPKRGEVQGLLLTGTMAGDILVWKAGKALFAVAAHEPGPPIVVKGVHQFGGVRALTLRKDKKTILSGGADGFVRVWNVEDGSFDAGEKRLLRMYVLGFAKESPPGVRAISCDWKGEGFVVGTSKCDVWEFGGRETKCLVYGHAGDLMAIAWHPGNHSVVASVTEGQRLNLFDVEKRDLLRTCSVGFAALAVHISPIPLPNGSRSNAGGGRFANLMGVGNKGGPGGRNNPNGSSHHIAIGGAGGRLKIVEEDTLAPVFVAKDLPTDIEEVRYSPDGTWLATCGRDQYIDIYSATKRYERYGRCFGHSSTVWHLDWSADSMTLQSVDSSYEILYWSVRPPAPIKQERANQRNTVWATQTATLGFGVMGIWPDATDGTDVNAVDRSNAGGHVVTADDFGDIKLFNYPCVVDRAAYKPYYGHSSHVVCIRFSPDDKWVISAGGHDRGLFQFKTEGIADWKLGSDMNPIGGPVIPASRLSRLEQEMKSKKGEELIWGPLDKAGRRWGYVRADGTAVDMEEGTWGTVGAGGDDGPREMKPSLPPRQPKQQAVTRPPSGMLPSISRAPQPPERGRFQPPKPQSDLRRVAEEGRGAPVRKAGMLPKLEAGGSPGGYSQNGNGNGNGNGHANGNGNGNSAAVQQSGWVGASKKAPGAPNGRANLRSARPAGGGGGGAGGGGGGGGGAPARDERVRGSWDSQR